jgi:protein-disulfide isomerase
VLVVEFNDYLCPACREAHFAYRPILDRLAIDNPGQVVFKSLDYPLEQECNPGTGGNTHTLACEAAAVVRLARPLGNDRTMIDWLFRNQRGLTEQALWNAARDVGGVVDGRRLYRSALADVVTDARLGQTLGVRGTPTIFINGVELPGGVAARYFEAAIEYELRR